MRAHLANLLRRVAGKIAPQYQLGDPSAYEQHPHLNRLPFKGCLALVDVASDQSPTGAYGRQVILTRDAAKQALPSLMGMAVNYKAGWDGHDPRQKCGIITAAHLDGRRLMVSGFLFARDFPEMENELGAVAGSATKGEMGMSYELADAHVADVVGAGHIAVHPV